MSVNSNCNTIIIYVTGKNEKIPKLAHVFTQTSVTQSMKRSLNILRPTHTTPILSMIKCWNKEAKLNY